MSSNIQSQWQRAHGRRRITGGSERVHPDSMGSFYSCTSVGQSQNQSEPEIKKVPLISEDETSNESFELGIECINPSRRGSSLKKMTVLDEPSNTIECNMPTSVAFNLANKFIKLSQYLKTPDHSELRCLDCHRVPDSPVTGQCGHTRCIRCIHKNGACPCSVDAPELLSVNTVVRELIEKMRYTKKTRITHSTARVANENTSQTRDGLTKLLFKPQPRLSLLSSSLAKAPKLSTCLSRPRFPLRLKNRYRKARRMLDKGNYLGAASHLARVAASSNPVARVARVLLAQTIDVCDVRSSNIVRRQLIQRIKAQSARSWLSKSDLECVLCTSTYESPVTTPCGHNYCRSCIARSMTYNKRCPLCLCRLENFYVDETCDNMFIKSMLSAIGIEQSLYEQDEIPIVTCEVAVPGIPYPLILFNPGCCQMVQSVMNSGKRQFGVLGFRYAAYGTILEIRDCIRLENDCCILSTVGVSRFKVLERYKKHGLDVARMQPWTDSEITRTQNRNLRLMASQLYSKAKHWLNSSGWSVREEIYTAFGRLPYDPIPNELTRDGPKWIWWLVATLPLNNNLKYMILTTPCLIKRMLAVSHILDLAMQDFKDELDNK